MYDGPLTDRVRLIACTRCGRPVLEALCEELLATRADLVRLTPAAELAHLAAGGHTVRLWPDRPGATQRMAFRDLAHLRAHPGRALPVHQCGVHHGHPDPQLLHPARPAAAEHGDQPPF